MKTQLIIIEIECSKCVPSL